jgi:hypothetical protein
MAENPNNKRARKGKFSQARGPAPAASQKHSLPVDNRRAKGAFSGARVAPARPSIKIPVVPKTIEQSMQDRISQPPTGGTLPLPQQPQATPQPPSAQPQAVPQQPQAPMQPQGMPQSPAMGIMQNPSHANIDPFGMAQPQAPSALPFSPSYGVPLQDPAQVTLSQQASDAFSGIQPAGAGANEDADNILGRGNALTNALNGDASGLDRQTQIATGTGRPVGIVPGQGQREFGGRDISQGSEIISSTRPGQNGGGRGAGADKSPEQRANIKFNNFQEAIRKLESKPNLSDMDKENLRVYKTKTLEGILANERTLTAPSGGGRGGSGIGGGDPNKIIDIDAAGNPITQEQLIKNRNANAGSERVERQQAKQKRNDLLRAASFAGTSGDTQSMAALVAQAGQVNQPRMGPAGALDRLKKRGTPTSADSAANLQKLKNEGALNVAKEESNVKREVAKAANIKSEQARNDRLEELANENGQMNSYEQAEFKSKNTELTDAISKRDSFRKTAKRTSSGKLSDANAKILGDLDIAVGQARTKLNKFIDGTRTAGKKRADRARSRKTGQGAGTKESPRVVYSEEEALRLDPGTVVILNGKRSTVPE